MRRAYLFGKRAVVNWWRGIRDPGVPEAYGTLSRPSRAAFWSGVAVKLAAIYGEHLLATAALVIGTVVVLAVVLGWGPF